MLTRTHPHSRLVTAVITAASLSACALRGPPPPGAPPSGPSPSGTAQPAPPTPEQPSPAPPERPAAPAGRQFHLGPAASALGTQAHPQAGGGEYRPAGATLARALR